MSEPSQEQLRDAGLEHFFRRLLKAVHERELALSRYHAAVEIGVSSGRPMSDDDRANMAALRAERERTAVELRKTWDEACQFLGDVP